MDEKNIFRINMLYYHKKTNNLNSIIFKYIIFILISLIIIVPSLAVSHHQNQSGIPENKTCTDCHAYYQTTNIPSETARITISNTPIISKSNSIQSFEVTNVVGNINLITGLGQDWYQQGIFGPSSSGVGIDKSWGWTFFDENPPTGYIVPSEKVIQRNNIYALLLDDGNNSNPITGANVVANVTYWTYNGTSYTSNKSSGLLVEDSNKKGFYNGTFNFYGGTSVLPTNPPLCGYCHFGNDNKAGYFPGNYSVSIKAEANGKTITKDANFEVTPWGCENCHGSGNQHSSGGVDLDSACFICHGTNRGHNDAGNVHQNTAHINIQCVDCHTNRSLRKGAGGFTNVAFAPGGINNNRPVPQYSYNIISLNRGNHSSLTCEYCHNSLILSSSMGGYKVEGYDIKGTINEYDPNFTGIQKFQDYYVINVTGAGSLNIDFNWDGDANIGFYLYPPNFDPRHGDTLHGKPYYDGSTYSKPEIYRNDAPEQGKWILQLYGYDLVNTIDLSYGILQLPINYTVNSTFPIKKNDLPSIPECNNCHYSGATGGANTTYEIPDWNPGFAHVDTNGDGTLDIQCRLCHDSMHNIGIKICQNCHTKAPINHPVLPNPGFNQYNPTQCLTCHGDPHRITGGTNCIACHSPGDVNISLFGKHAIINDSNGAGNVTNDDCWTCHFQKDMNRSNVYLCGSCHSNHTGIVSITNESLVMSSFMHDGTECRTCHAPIVSGYHLNGSVGPLGTVEKILGKIPNP